MINTGIYTNINERQVNEDIAFISYKNDNSSEVRLATSNIDALPGTPISYESCRVFACLLDGMGGTAGDKVSLVADAVATYYTAMLNNESFAQASIKVSDSMKNEQSGATVCHCVLDCNNVLEYSWLGDSRIYLYKKDENNLYLLSRDNNLACYNAIGFLKNNGLERYNQYASQSDFRASNNVLYGHLGRSFYDTATDMLKLEYHKLLYLCGENIASGTKCVLSQEVVDRCDNLSELKYVFNDCYEKCPFLPNKQLLKKIVDAVTNKSPTDYSSVLRMVRELCAEVHFETDFIDRYTSLSFADGVPKIICDSDFAEVVLDLQTNRIQLSEGDVVILCSDGVYSGVNADLKNYNIRDILTKSISKATGDLDLDCFCKTICEVCRADYSSSDNQTIVCFAVPGNIN